MNQQRDRGGGDFEQRLLTQLKSVVAERGAEEALAGEATTSGGHWGRGPRLALGAGVAVVGAVAAVLVVGGGGDNTSKAFAVEPQDGGGVTIKIHSLEDASGLQQALEEAGIPAQVTWLPAEMACREPHYTTSTVQTALGGSVGGFDEAGPGEALTIGVLSAEQYRERFQEFNKGEISPDEFHAMTGSVTLDPASFSPGQSVVLSGAPGPYLGDPEGGFEAHVGIAEGPVEPCDPVKTDSHNLRSMTNIIEAERRESQP